MSLRGAFRSSTLTLLIVVVSDGVMAVAASSSISVPIMSELLLLLEVFSKGVIEGFLADHSPKLFGLEAALDLHHPDRVRFFREDCEMTPIITNCYDSGTIRSLFVGSHNLINLDLQS